MVVRCGGNVETLTVLSRRLLSGRSASRKSPQRASAQDALSSNHQLHPWPGNTRHPRPTGQPSQGNTARMDGSYRPDWDDSCATALDNRTAPAPPTAPPRGRACVARGSYAGTFPLFSRPGRLARRSCQMRRGRYLETVNDVRCQFLAWSSGHVASTTGQWTLVRQETTDLSIHPGFRGP